MLPFHGKSREVEKKKVPFNDSIPSILTIRFHAFYDRSFLPLLSIPAIIYIYIYVYMMKFHSRTEKDVPQPVRLVARQIYDKQCDKHDREYDTPVASLLPLHARTASFRVRLSLIIR